MTTSTATANPNIAFINFTLAKLDWTNGKVYFWAKLAACWRAFFL